MSVIPFIVKRPLRGILVLLLSAGLLLSVFAILQPAQARAAGGSCKDYTLSYSDIKGGTDKIQLTGCETFTYEKQGNGSYVAVKSNGSTQPRGEATCTSTLVLSAARSGTVKNTTKFGTSVGAPTRQSICDPFPPEGSVTVNVDTIYNYAYYQQLWPALEPLNIQQSENTRITTIGDCWARARSDAARTAGLTAQGGGSYDTDAGTKNNFAACVSPKLGVSESAIKERIADISTSSVNGAATTAITGIDSSAASSQQALADDPCSGFDESSGGAAVRWLVCPAGQGLGAFVSGLDGMIENLLRFDTGDLGALRAAWSNVRNIGLALLVVIALVVIISQAIGAQFLDAYTIRKAAPRLVIAIILMTLSWPIMTFVLTLFNDLGGMIQNIILTPIANAAGGDASSITAGSIAAALLSGTAIAGIGAVVTGITLGWAGVMSLLLVVALSVLVLFMILALRWVVIMACLVLAPIAIVAFILPNTEKLWKVWFNGFIGALATFPAVMAVVALGKAAALLVLM